MEVECAVRGQFFMLSLLHACKRLADTCKGLADQ